MTLAIPALEVRRLSVLIPRWRVACLPISIAVFAVLVRLSVGPLTYDDAFITFRYARNLAIGEGLVYNPGEQVLGTTTPLWTLILAAFYRLGFHDLETVALVLSSVSDGVTTCLLYAAAQRFGLGHRWSIWLVGLFALCPLSVGFAASGMEASLFTALALGAMLSLRSPHLCGVLTGLVVLVRPEGLAVAGLIFVASVIQSRRIPFTWLIVTAVVVLPWVIYATATYGSPIPHSVLAKASHYSPGAHKNILWLTANLGAPGFSEPLLEHGPTAVRLTALAVGTFLLIRMRAFVPDLIRMLRRSPDLIPLACFAPALALALVVEGIRSAHIFPWYLVPLAPFALLAVVALIRRTNFERKALTLVAVSLFSLWTLGGLSLGRDDGLNVFAAHGTNLSRESAYREAAAFLVPALGPDAVIAAPEIGALGYFTNARILDTAGLVSPEAAGFYPLPSGYEDDITIPPGLIERSRPDAIVGLDYFLPSQLTEAPWFQAQYEVVKTLPAHIWDSTTVFVYLRRDR